MGFTLRQHKAHCHELAEDLLRHEQVSADALRAIAPGGAENPKRDTAAWVRYGEQLQLLRGRAQGPQGDGSAAAAAASRDDAIALASLAATAEVVRGFKAEYAVHPKSLAALLHCHARELLLGRLANVTAEVLDLDRDKLRPDLTHDALEEIGYQTRVLCWIACTEGPGLPFPETARDPELPAEWRELDPLSVVEINRAFARVNWVNLKVLQSLIAPDPEAGGVDSARRRPSWSMFIGALALELHESPVELIKNRSLASVLASTQLAAASHREAMAEAKRSAERERATAGA